MKGRKGSGKQIALLCVLVFLLGILQGCGTTEDNFDNIRLTAEEDTDIVFKRCMIPPLLRTMEAIIFSVPILRRQNRRI